MTYEEYMKYSNQQNNYGVDVNNYSSNDYGFNDSNIGLNGNQNSFDSAVTNNYQDNVGGANRFSNGSFNVKDNSEYNWNKQDTLDAAGLGIDGFNAWMAYKNYAEQKKNNKFNRKLGRANYKNEAKAFNMQVEDKARYRRSMRGDTSNEINNYLRDNKDYRDRLANLTF